MKASKGKASPKQKKLFKKIIHFHREFSAVSIAVHVILTIILSYMLAPKYPYSGLFLSSSLFCASLLAFDLVIAARYNVFVMGGPGIAAYSVKSNKHYIIANALFYIVFIVFMMRAFLLSIHAT
jgi:hypothetical protein